MAKGHFQSAKVYAAEDALRRPGALSGPRAELLALRVAADFDVPAPVVPPGPTTQVAVLHRMAHVLTDPTFPPHGAEFAATWHALVHKYAGEAVGRELLKQYAERGVHHEPETRAERVRRNGVYFARAMPGAIVELILDDPPLRGRGSIEACDADRIRVGGQDFPLARARYLERASS